MSIQGRMMAVPASVAEALRARPDAVEELLGASVAGIDGDPAAVLDELLREAPGVGCLWRLLPGFLRRALLGRVMRRLPQGPTLDDAPLPTLEQLHASLEVQANAAGLSDEQRAALFSQAEAQLEQARARKEAREQGVAAAEEPVDAPAPDVLAEQLPSLDLHKDWHLLHFALTGSAEEGEGPAFDAILGGEEVGEDLGYGPARLLGPADVARVAAHLEALDPAAVVKALDVAAAQAADVYGADAARDREVRRGLVDRLRALREHYVAAADRGDSMLLWMD